MVGKLYGRALLNVIHSAGNFRQGGGDSQESQETCQLNPTSGKRLCQYIYMYVLTNRTI